MSRRADLRLALIALAVGAVGTAWALVAPGGVPEVLTGLIAPLLLVLVGGGALRRIGLLSSGAAPAAVALGTVALASGLAARASWSTGFDEADAGQPQGPLAAAWLPLVALAWALGTAAIAPVFTTVFHDIRSRPARTLLAATVAAVIAVALGIALALPAFAVIAAVGVLFLLTWRREARPPAAAARGDLWPTRALGALAAVTLVGGTASLVVAFTGSSWPGFPGDGTRAMNVGLALAGVSALPLTVAAGAALRSLPRHRRSLAPVFGVAAVLIGIAAQVAGAGAGAGAGETVQQPLLLCAAGAAGIAGALIALPALPSLGAWRPVVGAALAVGLGTAVGLPLVVVVPVIAPAVAAVVLVVLRRRGGAAASRGGRAVST